MLRLKLVAAAQLRWVAALFVATLAAWCGCDRTEPQAKSVSTTKSQPASKPIVPADLVAEGMTWLSSDDVDRAVDLFSKAIEADPKRLDAYLGRARAQARRGRLAQADADYTRAIELRPRDPELLMQRASLRQMRGRLDLALADCNVAIALDPKRMRGAYSFRANLHLANGELDAAIADCDRAIELDADMAPAYNNRALAQQRKGNLAAAIADYTRAIERNKQFAEAFHNRGAAYVLAGEDDKALADFSEAIHLQPVLPLPYHNRGRLYLRRGNADKAIADFSMLLRLIEKSHGDFAAGSARIGRQTADVYAQRAQAHWLKGDREECRADCRAALAIDPQCRLALDLLQRLSERSE